MCFLSYLVFKSIIIIIIILMKLDKNVKLHFITKKIVISVYKTVKKK